MSRTGWILLFVLIALCVYASSQTEHLVGGQMTPAKCNTDYTFEVGKGCTRAGTQGSLPSRCDAGTTLVPDPTLQTPGMCRADRAEPVAPSTGGMTCPQIQQRFTDAALNMGVPPSFNDFPPGCNPPAWFPQTPGASPSIGELIDLHGSGRFTAAAAALARQSGSQPQPESTKPPKPSQATPAKVAPAALNGLQVGGPNDGGIGPSPPGSGNASWGGSGVKYPNLLGPDPKAKKDNLPDNNITAKLTLPTPCQVGADGNTLYSTGCRAPTDLGYFTLPSIPKTNGDPSPFSEDYTVFMR